MGLREPRWERHSLCDRSGQARGIHGGTFKWGSGVLRAGFGEDNSVVIKHGLLELELSDHCNSWAVFSKISKLRPIRKMVPT